MTSHSPSDWWSRLLGPLAAAVPEQVAPSSDPGGLDDRWAAGPGLLTGRDGGALLDPPPGLTARLGALGDALGSMTGRTVDPFAELAARAPHLGPSLRGRVSCGGATHLLRTADDWVALALARDDDRSLLHALLEDQRVAVDGSWDLVAEIVRSRRAHSLVERATLLGLPIARLGEVGCPSPAVPAVRAHRLAAAAPDDRRLRVVDLSSLWAGPLCGRLLGDAGAEVMKLESVERPDGARSGPPALFDALNADKVQHRVAFSTAAGRAALLEVLQGADVVIEASRPRALEQLGIDRASMVREHGVSAWISITGYGLDGPSRDRVAFGDDAAVAGGLVARDEGGPVFCADAIADPLTGMTAALAVLLAQRLGGGWLLDVPLARVAAAFAGGAT